MTPVQSARNWKLWRENNKYLWVHEKEMEGFASLLSGKFDDGPLQQGAEHLLQRMTANPLLDKG